MAPAKEYPGRQGPVPQPPDSPPASIICKSFDERTPDSQRRINQALRAFRTFRERQGEKLPADPWAVPPPSLLTLLMYLTYLQLCSRSWRDVAVAALRLQLVHVGHESLARQIYAPRGRGASPPPDIPVLPLRKVIALTPDHKAPHGGLPIPPSEGD